MRILWSIHLYPPTHNCGSEWMAHHINKFLISKGYEVQVIMHHYSGRPFVHEGVWVLPATGSLDAFRWADVICTHLDFTQYTMAMADKVQKPVIHFSHNDIPYNALRCVHRNNYVVYNSSWIKDALNYKLPGYVLRPPCDIDYYAVNDAPQSSEYITLIGLNERKGGMLLAEIAALIPDRKFIGVAGSYDNPGKNGLTQQQIISRMPSNVTVVPNTPDILSIYKKTRLLLMPSDYESWGRTATEAMCSGIPVICTPTPGLKENCRKAAEYVGKPLDEPNPGLAQVDTGDAASWVAAIRKFDKPEFYRKKSLLCKRRAAELDPGPELEGLEQFIRAARYV